MTEKRYITPLGGDGIYCLDTASWRSVRPVMDKTKCINCGICSYVCPSKLPLTQTIAKYCKPVEEDDLCN